SRRSPCSRRVSVRGRGASLPKRNRKDDAEQKSNGRDKLCFQQAVNASLRAELGCASFDMGQIRSLFGIQSSHAKWYFLGRGGKSILAAFGEMRQSARVIIHLARVPTINPRAAKLTAIEVRGLLFRRVAFLRPAIRSASNAGFFHRY